MMRRPQAEQMRVVRITKTAFEELATRAGVYVVWHEPDANVYTPTVYLGPPPRVTWTNLAIDLAGVLMAMVAGAVFGVALS